MSRSAPARSASVAVCRPCTSWSTWNPCCKASSERSTARIRSGTCVRSSSRWPSTWVMYSVLNSDMLGPIGPVNGCVIARSSWTSSIADEAIGQAADGAGDAGAGRTVRVARRRALVERDAEARVRRGSAACRRRSSSGPSSRPRRTSTTTRPSTAGTRSTGSPARWRRRAGWRRARSARRTREARRATPKYAAAAAIRRASVMPPHVDASGCSTVQLAAAHAPRARRRCRRGARRRRSAPATRRRAARCRRARPAAAAPRTTYPEVVQPAGDAPAPSGSVKISLPSTISSTPGSSEPRSVASVSRSRRHSGPTRTLTFVTPWASSGSSSSRWHDAGPSSRKTLDAYTSTLVAHPAEQGGRPSDRRSWPSDVPQRDLDGAAGLGGDPSIAEAAPGEQAQPLGERLDGADRLPDEQRRERLVDDGPTTPAYEQP